MKKVLALTLVGLFAIAGNAMALTVSPDSWDGEENNLQNIFNDFTVGGDSSVDVYKDAIDDSADSYWLQTATGTSAVTMIIEIAGFADTNKFGIYDKANADTKYELFDGTDSPGLANGGKTAFSILDTGELFINFQSTGVFFEDQSFGFYLDSSAKESGGIFYSDTSLNSDGLDHMAAYQGVDDKVQIADSNEATWNDNEYILAWEDLAYTGEGSTDLDYNDMVVMIESIEPVATPEPGTVLLMGVGLLGLIGIGRKRMKK